MSPVKEDGHFNFRLNTVSDLQQDHEQKELAFAFALTKGAWIGNGK
jgi:hypothetical protein